MVSQFTDIRRTRHCAAHISTPRLPSVWPQGWGDFFAFSCAWRVCCPWFTIGRPEARWKSFGIGVTLYREN
jgi:hypothetical protein